MTEPVMVRTRSSFITWSFWLSLLRLLSTVVIVPFTIFVPGIVPGSESASRTSVGQIVPWTISWLVFSFNDVFMLTIDFKQTDTYLGCVAAQTILNSSLIIISICYPFLQSEDLVIFFLLIGFPLLFVGLSSLFLFGSILQLAFMRRSHVPANCAWKINTKHMYMLSGSPLVPTQLHPLSLFGHPRDIPIKNPGVQSLHTFGRGAKRFAVHLFFRRVRPVETRAYAFVRNTFAVFAIIILLFRTITALLQAQNEIGTRIISTVCDRSSRSTPWNRDIHLVAERKVIGEQYGRGPLNIIVRASYGESSANCTHLESKPIELYNNRVLETFVCPNPSQLNRSQSGTLDELRDFSAIHVQISRGDGSALTNDYMPPIWLVNGLEQPSNLSSPNANAARHYIPGWVLRPGFHTEAQAKLITKRLIRSSFLRDIVFNSKPTYTPISLYPIFESGMLTYPNTSIATATVRITLMPAFMYFRTQLASEDYLHESKHPSYLIESCDYVDDYRLGTVLDVVGSVGGLFALLQAVHVLLFGRPLLWGLTGTKLLTPFGLLGACSSKRFKQRLYEKYHKKPTENDSDTIRITKFLSDFIIDFGPADHNPEGYSPLEPAPSPELVASEHITSAEIPLVIAMEPGSRLTPHNENPTESRKCSNNRISDVV